MKKDVCRDCVHLFFIDIYTLNVYYIDMKRRDLIKKLEAKGFILVRHGAKHDVYKRGSDEEQVPRHNEINELLARKIIKKWNL